MQGKCLLCKSVFMVFIMEVKLLLSFSPLGILCIRTPLHIVQIQSQGIKKNKGMNWIYQGILKMINFHYRGEKSHVAIDLLFQNSGAMVKNYCFFNKYGVFKNIEKLTIGVHILKTRKNMWPTKPLFLSALSFDFAALECQQSQLTSSQLKVAVKTIIEISETDELSVLAGNKLLK